MKKLFFALTSILAVILVATNLMASENNNKGSTAEGNYYKTFDAAGLTIVSDAIAIDGTTVNLVRSGAISMINSQDYNAKEVENGDIEQWVSKDISPQSSNNMMTGDLQEEAFKYKTQQTGMIMRNQTTTTTQMQAISDAQWRNSYNLNSGLDIMVMWLQGSGTAVPSVFPGIGIELSSVNNEINLTASNNELVAANITNRTNAAPRIWPMISSNETTTTTALSFYS